MEHKNKTVVKAMTLLNLFLTRERLSLGDMIELTGMPKTSVYRMVCSLEEMGFLDRDENGMYSLGLLFLQYGHLVSERLDIRKIALPIMEELRDDVDEAVHLIVRQGNEAMYIEKIEGTQTVRLYTAIGRRSPLYAGACARSILTFLPEEERDAYIEQTELVPIASGTIRDKAELIRIVDESYRRRYARSVIRSSKTTPPRLPRRFSIISAKSRLGSASPGLKPAFRKTVFLI